MKPKIAVIVTGLVAGLAIGKGYADETTAKPAKLLDYIESTGAQYIDTGVEAKMGTKAALDIMWTAVTGWDVEMFSANGAGNTNYKLLDGSASGSFYIYPTVGSSSFFVGKSNLSNWPYSANFVTYANNTRYRVSVGISTDGVYSFAINGGAYTQSGTATKSVGTIAASGQNFYLFGCNNNGTASNYSDTKACCYGAKIWQTDEGGEYKLVRDFLPCLDSKGVAGLYDSVSGEIFYSKTDTAFIAGPVPPEIPDKFVEYVYSDGKQFVDTGIEGKMGTRAEMTITWSSFPYLSTFLGTFGGYSRWYTLCETFGSNGLYLYVGSWAGYASSMTGWPYGASKPAQNNLYTILAEISNKGIYSLSVSGSGFTQSGTATKEVGQITASGDRYKFYMFANNNMGTMDRAFSGRCYGTKIWQTDASGEYKIVRDFKPCVKGGRPGLYDAVSRRIFYSGSGTDLLVDENTELAKCWVNNTGDGSFDNPLNWSDFAVPQTGDSVAVVSTEGTVIAANNDYSLGTISVPNGAAVFGGGSGTVTPDEVSVASGAMLATGGALRLTTLPIPSGATVEITGAEGLADGKITGAGTLVINPGAGNTLTMTKSNTGFTGTAVVKSGTVKFSDTRSFGAQPSTIRVKGGATLDENNLFGDWAYNQEKNKVILEQGAKLISENGTGGVGCHITTVTLDGDATVDTTSGQVWMAYGWDYNPTHINLGEHTLTKTGATDFYISCCQISGSGMFDITEGRVVASPTLYGRGNSATTCANGTIKIRSGASIYLQDKSDDSAGKMTLSVNNLVLDGSVTRGTKNEHMLTVTGSITGKGTTPMLTMGSGAVFKPNGTDFLTITDSLSGTMTIDVSELVFTDRKDDIPLFKVGNASILPAKGDVVVNGELPVPWRLTTTSDGLGYRLNREQGTIITIR